MMIINKSFWKAKTQKIRYNSEIDRKVEMQQKIGNETRNTKEIQH